MPTTQFPDLTGLTNLAFQVVSVSSLSGDRAKDITSARFPRDQQNSISEYQRLTSVLGSAHHMRPNDLLASEFGTFPKSLISR